MRIMTPAAKMVANTLSSTSGRTRDVFRNQRGAVDLPSIMVGAIVLGLLTAAILATVFTVIPWAQDNAAKQKVSQIVSAESAYYALSSDGSLTGATATGPHYGSPADLVREDLLTASAADIAVGGKISIVTQNATAGGSIASDTFVATVKSDTGNSFSASNTEPQPK